MKKIFFLFIFVCFFNISSKSQYVLLVGGLHDTLYAMFPGCFNNGYLDTTCAELTTIRHLDISSEGRYSISGVQYLDSLKYLNCSGNALSEIFALPGSLDTLICRSQYDAGFINGYRFASLPPLPATLRYLDISNNGFSTIQGLNEGLRWLDCSGNKFHHSSGLFGPTLQSIVSLPSSLVYLNCSASCLTSLPVLPPALEYLDASYSKFYVSNGIFTFNFPGISFVPNLPSALSVCKLSTNNINCLPQLPASLDSLYAGGNNLTCLTNIVPGMFIDYPLPVCTQANDTHGCGPFPYIAASPTIISLTTLSGTASASGTYNLSAHDLNPASGNVSISASAFLELSTDNVNFSSSLSIPYTGAVLATTQIYVRISSSAQPGLLAGTVTNSAEMQMTL